MKVQSIIKVGTINNSEEIPHNTYKFSHIAQTTLISEYVSTVISIPAARHLIKVTCLAKKQHWNLIYKLLEQIFIVFRSNGMSALVFVPIHNLKPVKRANLPFTMKCSL